MKESLQRSWCTISKVIPLDECLRRAGACDGDVSPYCGGSYRKRPWSDFRTAGDSVLTEFPSIVVHAFNCAVAIQQAMWRTTGRLPTTGRFRVGINIGDVFSEGDIFGDGANIAARLERLGEAGGVCMTSGIQDPYARSRICQSIRGASSSTSPIFGWQTFAPIKHITIVATTSERTDEKADCACAGNVRKLWERPDV